MNGINNIQAEGQLYDILAPEVVNEYVEKLGKPCVNPNGYTRGSLILATDGSNVQRLYKVTQNISSNQNIVENGNVVNKKLEDLFDDLEVELSGEIADVDTELGNVKQALSNEVVTRSSLGAKNFVYNARNLATQVINKVTYTVNSDGTYTCDSSGQTLDAASNFKISDKSTNYFTLPKKGTYILSGCEGGSNTTYFLGYEIWSPDGSTLYGAKAIKSGEETFSVPSDGARVTCYIQFYATAGVVNNVTFKPMIRLASDADPTYQPYAMTNQQLTALVDGSKAGNELSATVPISIGGNMYLYKKGRIVIAEFDFGGTAPTELGQSIGTIPEGFRPTHTHYASCIGRTAGAWANADFNSALLRMQYGGGVEVLSKLSENNLYFSGSTSWFWHE